MKKVSFTVCVLSFSSSLLVQEVYVKGVKETNAQIEQQFIATVQEAEKVTSSSLFDNSLMCESSDPLTRQNTRYHMNRKTISSKSIGADVHIKKGISHQNEEFYHGYEITMKGPNEFAPVIKELNFVTHRSWNFISEDEAVNESFVWVIDSPNVFLSERMESLFVLLPRKEKSRVEIEGDEIHAILPTSELVIYDAKTKFIKKGAFAEEAIDTHPDRFKRTFRMKYTGEGISLRVDRRGGDPRNGTGNLVITQKNKTCSLPNNLFWENPDYPKFKFDDDAKLIQFLNSKCKTQFSL